MRCAGLAMVMLLLLGGCARTVDVRARLLESARTQDPDFPDGRVLQLAQFAYLGCVATPEGKVHVASRRIVTTSQRTPRWQSAIDFYDEDYQLLRSYSGADLPMPLWCEGAKVYLWGFGRIPGIPVALEARSLFTDDRDATGNVLDLSQGFSGMLLRREKRYGSSGGVDDDPFAVAAPRR